MDMPATNTTTAHRAERMAAMSATTTITTGTSRWLSSQGHPGYGQKFAATVWDYIVAQFGADEFVAAPTMRQSGMVWAGVRAAQVAR